MDLTSIDSPQSYHKGLFPPGRGLELLELLAERLYSSLVPQAVTGHVAHAGGCLALVQSDTLCESLHPLRRHRGALLRMNGTTSQPPVGLDGPAGPSCSELRAVARRHREQGPASAPVVVAVVRRTRLIPAVGRLQGGCPEGGAVEAPPGSCTPNRGPSQGEEYCLRP